MHYRVAICDDEPAASSYVESLVHQWAQSRGHGICCEVYRSAEAYLFAHSTGGDFDILLLDIEMGPINGVELARRLRRKTSVPRSSSSRAIAITSPKDMMWKLCTI